MMWHQVSHRLLSHELQSLFGRPPGWMRPAEVAQEAPCHHGEFRMQRSAGQGNRPFVILL